MEQLNDIIKKQIKIEPIKQMSNFLQFNKIFGLINLGQRCFCCFFCETRRHRLIESYSNCLSKSKIFFITLSIATSVEK